MRTAVNDHFVVLDSILYESSEQRHSLFEFFLLLFLDSANVASFSLFLFTWTVARQRLSIHYTYL